MFLVVLILISNCSLNAGYYPAHRLHISIVVDPSPMVNLRFIRPWTYVPTCLCQYGAFL